MIKEGNILNIIRPEWIFYILFGLFFLLAIFSFVPLYHQNMETVFFLYRLLNYVFICSILMNLFVYKTYTFRKFLIHLFLSILFYYVGSVMHYPWLLYTWFLVMSIGPIKFEKIAGFVGRLTLCIISYIVLLAGFGVLENYIFYRADSILFNRLCFGFSNPNVLPALLFQVSCCLLYLRWKRWSYKENLVLLSFFLISAFISNCRTVSVLLLMMIFIVNLCKYILKNKTTDFLRNFGFFSLIFCPAFAFIFSYLYANSNKLALILNDLMQYRLRNLSFSMDYYGLSLFGQPIDKVHDLHVTDVGYANILLNYGILLFILFMTVYAILIKKSADYKCAPLLLILNLYLYYGLMENIFLMPVLNVSFLLFSGLLNNNQIFIAEKEE